MPQPPDPLNVKEMDITECRILLEESFLNLIGAIECIEKMKKLRGTALRSYVYETADWLCASIDDMAKWKSCRQSKPKKGKKNADGNTEIDGN